MSSDTPHSGRSHSFPSFRAGRFRLIAVSHFFAFPSTAWRLVAHFLLLVLWIAAPALHLHGQEGTPPAQPSSAADSKSRELFWKGDRLADWTISEFGSQREVKQLEDGFEIQAGYPLSGVQTTAQDWPRDDYEIEWEFQRVEGNDFPCCLTFPVADSHCSVVIGGWGGTLVGLSCIEGQDAAHNDTAKHLVFENGKWYRARLQVQGDRIRCWIDDREVISRDIKDQKLSVRNEVQLSRPLGICSFESTSRIRNFRVYRLLREEK